MALEELIITSYGSRTGFVQEARRRGYDITDQKVSNGFGGRRKRGPDWDLTTCIVRCCVDDANYTWELGRIATLWANANGTLRPPGYTGMLLPPPLYEFDNGDGYGGHIDHIFAATKGLRPLTDGLVENNDEDAYAGTRREPKPVPVYLNCRREETVQRVADCISRLLLIIAISPICFYVLAGRNDFDAQKRLLGGSLAATVAIGLLYPMVRPYFLPRASVRPQFVNGDIPVGKSSFTWTLPPGAVRATTFRPSPRRARSRLWRRIFRRYEVTPSVACINGHLVLTSDLAEVPAPDIATTGWRPSPKTNDRPIVEWMLTFQDQVLLALGVLSIEGGAMYKVAADPNEWVIEGSLSAVVLRYITMAPPPDEVRLLLRRIDSHDSVARIHWNNPGWHVHHLR
jgi:hypothetical protein